MIIVGDANMKNSESHREYLIETFKTDPEARYAYAEDFLDTVIASQIYVLREQRGMTQAELAAAIGTKQSGISRLEDINHSAWKTQTLTKIARALDVRLRVTFETFGTLLDEDDKFSRKSLQRPKFEDDPAFHDIANLTEKAALVSNVIMLSEWASKSGIVASGVATSAKVAHTSAATEPQQPPLFLDKPRKGKKSRRRRSTTEQQQQGKKSKRQQSDHRSIELSTPTNEATGAYCIESAA